MKAKYICPILTSMNEDGSVNYEEMHAFYDRVLQAGIDGILVGGSAGEFYAFTYDEIRTFILDAVKYIGNRGVVIAGTGRMAKSETISLSNEALQAGADAVIVVGPYYSACNEDDVYAYYDEILQAVKGPVYLYNYSDRTGYDVSDGVDTMSEAEYREAAIEAIQKLADDVEIPKSLAEAGVKEDDIEFLAQSAFADVCTPGNPRDTSVEDIKTIYRSIL